MKEPACRCSIHGRRIPSDGKKAQPSDMGRCRIVREVGALSHVALSHVVRWAVIARGVIARGRVHLFKGQSMRYAMPYRTIVP